MAARKQASRPRTTKSRTKKAPGSRRAAASTSNTRRKTLPRASKAARSTGRPAAKARPAKAKQISKRPKPKQAPKATLKPLRARARVTTRRVTVATKRPAPVRRSAAKRPVRKPVTPARKAAVPKALAKGRRPMPSPRKAIPPVRPPAPAPFKAPTPSTNKSAQTRSTPPPGLSRQRRRLADVEAASLVDPDQARLSSSAHNGRDQLKELLGHHTDTSPILAAGDVDARWSDAYAIGDEAPGGDNPTPDQDRVDDIGKALGVNYEDNEELRGSDKILERDRHRWELDPASSDDWPHSQD